MDYTWLILFILISVVSSILSRRKEKAKGEAAGPQQDTSMPEGRGERKPRPAGTGPPVAPGPFGPVLRPKPSRLPEPKPAPVSERRAPPDTRQPVLPTERTGTGRTLFDDMRADLERREREKASRDDRWEQRPEPEWQPLRPMPSEIAPKPAPSAPLTPPAVPRLQPEGVSSTQRIVADALATPRAERQGARRALQFDSNSVRQALIMAEIVGKPVGMRFQHDPWDSF